MQKGLQRPPSMPNGSGSGGPGAGGATTTPHGPRTPNFPPPYRSPPTPGMMGGGSGFKQHQHQQQQQQQQLVGGGAYSKFNVSEPNIGGGNGFTGSPISYRHTLNEGGAKHVQMGLRSMFNSNGSNNNNNNNNNGGPPHHPHPHNQHGPIAMKHRTLDSAGQHLRMNGGQQQQHKLLPALPSGDTYVSPDNLRDAANRIFARNQHERSSFNVMTAQQQHYANSHPTMQAPMTNGEATEPQQPFYSNQQLMPQQHQEQQKQVRFSNGDSTDDPRRNSYANQSFRKATGQQEQLLQKMAPVVPPKPGGSRSTSRERLKESLEEVDNLDQELKHILRGNAVTSLTASSTSATAGQRLSVGGGTPTLPALSPDPTPGSSPSNNNSKHTNSNRPDLLETGQRSNSKSQQQQKSNPRAISSGMRRYQDELTSQVTQSSAGGITADLESVLGLQTDLTSDESIDVGDAAAIRRQLDGLEGMYSEVLKLLGLRKYGRAAPNGSATPLEGMRRRKLYGSMSSLPSVSSIGSRHLYKDRSGARDKTKRPGSGGGSREKSHQKRFQRLESHVVTLARSVAHLSSEIRGAQSLAQEVEALRMEVQQLKSSGNRPPIAGYMDPESFFGQQNTGAHHLLNGESPRVDRSQARRVRKLTKFFGAEPPLLRLFLKDLGYEKYASAFEEAKIGLLELPYLSEDRLDRLGVPMGPRMRILQEARAKIASEPNYNVYIL